MFKHAIGDVHTYPAVAQNLKMVQPDDEAWEGAEWRAPEAPAPAAPPGGFYGRRRSVHLEELNHKAWTFDGELSIVSHEPAPAEYRARRADCVGRDAVALTMTVLQAKGIGGLSPARSPTLSRECKQGKTKDELPPSVLQEIDRIKGKSPVREVRPHYGRRRASDHDYWPHFLPADEDNQNAAAPLDSITCPQVRSPPKARVEKPSGGVGAGVGVSPGGVHAVRVCSNRDAALPSVFIKLQPPRMRAPAYTFERAVSAAH